MTDDHLDALDFGTAAASSTAEAAASSVFGLPVFSAASAGAELVALKQLNMSGSDAKAFGLAIGVCASVTAFIVSWGTVA